MVDEEGHAKVLDFGIAKLVEQSRESADRSADRLEGRDQSRRRDGHGALHVARADARAQRY